MKANKLYTLILVGLLSACGGIQKEQKGTVDKEQKLKNDKEVSLKEVSDTVKKQAVKVNTKAKEVAFKDRKSMSLQYRSDGFHPGVTSEWLKVEIDEKSNKIKSIFYWSTADEKPIKLNIFKQEYTSGEISGFTVELGFPNSPEVLKLGLIEDKANLTWADGQFQEFEMESK